ncbi:MAG: carbamoyltransferase HypF [Nitrospirae bacterium]|nr:carbamoyltransferase HypF [Nitrospirota bacterium]
MKSFLLSIKGIVQGVGFRPFVYNLAKEFGVKGSVRNTSGGVVIEVEGDRCEDFIDAVQRRHPPLAKIDTVDVREVPAKGHDDFIIISSSDSGSFTLVSPDASLCDECRNELFNPLDRRYLYPFINCTNCGPRYSITRQVPYDRPNTTMAPFSMCTKCMSEYNEPGSRRFHAQPNACSQCGPAVELVIKGRDCSVEEIRDPIKTAIDLLKQGAIIAVKGIGGFHLCCDAENETAVQKLREKKRRSNKPFAVMSPATDIIKKYCAVSAEEDRLLKDWRRPIVLLKKRVNGGDKNEIALPYDVAPKNKYLGFMLPYTPLHYLLFHNPAADGLQSAAYHFKALVMTSGNISEEPIVIDNNEAADKLSDIADAFLFHNRDIFMRVDDSVVKIKSRKMEGTAARFVRRARGFVPDPILLKDDGPDVLGCGADLKNCFAITKGNYAVVSQHMGDMENLETLLFFEETLANLKQVYRSEPVALAYDLHPGYLSTQWALRQISRSDIKGYAVQHHYAHIASVMAENGLTDKVIGIALDGTGYGTDGNLWGGEFLVCGIGGFSRAAHFNYMPLPGGERAIKECWRTAISAIVGASRIRERDPERLKRIVMENLEAVSFVDRYGYETVEMMLKLAVNRQFSPLSSGAGRLFDAVSALAGVCDSNTFEGEAAIALENEIEEGISDSYAFAVLGSGPLNIDFSETVLQIIDEVKSGELKSRIAARFHNTIVDAIAAAASRIRDSYGIGHVALSGGVFQNSYIFERAVGALEPLGFKVFANIHVPCNDACISLGQAYLLRERLKAGLPLSD